MNGKVQAVIIGCGYVADLYMADLKQTHDLEVIGCHDISMHRLKLFSDFHNITPFYSLVEVTNSSADLWIILTNPPSHVELCTKALNANKHIFCEKPLGGLVEDLQDLFEIARVKNLCFQVAPSNIYSETNAELKSMLTSKKLGTSKLAYINYEAGMTHVLGYGSWLSKSGAPWPAQEEFKLGCLIEHGGYILTLVCWLWGDVESVQSMAATIYPDKGINETDLAPDLNILLVKMKNGMHIKISVGMVASPDRSFTIFSDIGTIHIRDIRDDNAPIFQTSYPATRISRALHVRGYIFANFLSKLIGIIPSFWNFKSELYSTSFSARNYINIASKKSKNADFSLGIKHLISNMLVNKPDYTSLKISIHVQEILNELTIKSNDYHKTNTSAK